MGNYINMKIAKVPLKAAFPALIYSHTDKYNKYIKFWQNVDLHKK